MTELSRRALGRYHCFSAVAQQRGTFAAAALLLAASACHSAADNRSHTVEVSTLDLHHFVQAYKTLNPADSTCRGLSTYFASATIGLKRYEKKFDMGPSDLCHAIRRAPRGYSSLESKMPAFDAAQASIDSAFAALRSVYPPAVFPSVYIVVGDGISGGTSLRTEPPTVLVGAELTDSPSGLQLMVSHELAHAQQQYPWWKLLGAGPSFIRGTLLAQCIKEGSADFIAQLITGKQPGSQRNLYALAHEHELWKQFRQDMHGTDYSRWLYNGGSVAYGVPTDLGYWIGYRITKSYYDKAPDKAKAVNAIFHIRDFDSFLVESGYNPGA
ncbi:MAG: DUF2268 domain-containing putative Zn-dependent protease [Gemmatimonadaceae bacterium]